VNLQSGAPYSQTEAQSQCQQLLAAAPSQCEDEVADLRSCWGSVPSPAQSNADCDCSSEVDAILSCE
jgi:hypothetical protein